MDRRAFVAGSSRAIAALALGGGAREVAGQPAPEMPAGFTRLRVTEGELAVDGKTGKAYHILQDSGAHGYTGAKGERFRVALENTTREPVSIHWHGLILPNGQDGVPYVTQAPVAPGGRRLYDFPLVQAGTYWMHSHWSFQEQPMMTAPLILRDPRAGDPGEQEVVVMLNDFTTRDPAAILAELQGRGSAGMTPGRGGSMSGMAMGPSAKGGPDLGDVRYDALLANRRSLSDPEVVRVLPGRTVRLRVIAAGSATNFFVGTGALPAQAIAVDGEEVVPLPGSLFELGIAQRIDLRVRVPRREGAYPVLFQGEGTRLRAGIVLATPGAPIPTVSADAPSAAGALTNTQEARLRAAQPLAERPVDRRLRVALNGDMGRYVWALNGQRWPQITPLEVKTGERVEIAFANETGMAHPMHLHGHVFQVTEVGGRRVRGAKRDTVLVGPKQTLKVELDAAYPGYWMLHCHILYHAAAGMMTVLRYAGFENRSYDPIASGAEFRR
jgi:FtsP/CotA-like multicopper oxidase with cupredoxin domain